MPPLSRQHQSPPIRFLATGMVALCLVVASGCDSSEPISGPPPTKELPTRQATIITVQLQAWPQIVRSQGVLVADEVAAIGAKVAGSVSQVKIEVGDVVQAGDPLIELDQEEFRLQVEQAGAELAQARSAVGLKSGDPVSSLEPQNSPPVRQERALRDEAMAQLARARDLQSQSVIAQADFDQIVAAERVAEARYGGALNSVQEKIAVIGVREVALELARERLRNATVRAPFDGIVQQRQVAPGSYVQIGDSIATLVRTNPLRFRGTIPERRAQSLVVGQEVRLQIEGVAQPCRVRVTRISPSLEQSSRSLMFEADLDNQDQQLRAGLFAEAEIVVDPNAMAVVVPHSTVVEFAGAEKVWKVVDGIAVEQEVLAGPRRAQGIEILRGLAEGDVILREGSSGSVARITPLAAQDEVNAPEDLHDELIDRSPQPAGESSPVSNVSG
ncbi:MAG: efflux RND transporter periplasmic adaptor subunit [Planctomycetota bacterium]